MGWMLPANQRLDRHDLSTVDGVARLEMQDEFVVFHGLAQVAFQLATMLDLIVHLRGEIAPGFLALGLGLVHGNVGAADQFTGHITLTVAQGDTDTGADVQ
ncbi:hypothetical protein D3C76_1284080 [compost metagenome]